LYGRIQRTFPHHLRCVRASHPTAKKRLRYSCGCMRRLTLSHIEAIQTATEAGRAIRETAIRRQWRVTKRHSGVF
jgi:hypothetical protein